MQAEWLRQTQRLEAMVRSSSSSNTSSNEDFDNDDVLFSSPPPELNIKLPSNNNNNNNLDDKSCEDCEVQVATIWCKDCELQYCSACDTHRHRKGRLMKHSRSPLETSKSPSLWTAIDIQCWLIRIQLRECIPLLSDVNNGSHLLTIGSDSILKSEFNVTRPLHRKKLVREIQKLVSKPLLQNRLRRPTPPPDNLRIEDSCRRRRSSSRVVRRKKGNNIPSLDLDTLRTGSANVRESFHFTEEGTLKTQGFEINPVGLMQTPSGSNQMTQSSALCTKDCLIRLDELGQGEGGKVYRALYAPTLRLVAVKVIRLYDKSKRHQMVRELKSLHTNFTPLCPSPNSNNNNNAEDTSCPDLVAFHDVYTNPEKGTVSIVLEYMTNGSLEDILSCGKSVSEESLAKIARSTLRGLAFIHSQRQLHRDIKPSNILLCRSGEAKISDFGISRDLESTLAQATTFTGTLMYMSPERISGGVYSYPSDIWSLGLSLFAVAIGRLPLPVKDGYWGVVHAVQQLPSPVLSSYGNNYSLALCDFLSLFLKKDPAERPSASELLQHEFLKTREVKDVKETVSATIYDDTDAKSIIHRYVEWKKCRNVLAKEDPLQAQNFKALAKQLDVPAEFLLQEYYDNCTS